MSNRLTLPQFTLALGPLAAGILFAFLVYFQWLNTPSAITAAVTLWCAIWWLTEPVPIPVTSLLPMALFPLLGVLSPQAVAQSYGSPLILLLLGGFMLSEALAKCGAHRRLALVMIHLSARLGMRGLVFGFMLASAVLSMWISNTATTLMLLPVALAVLDNDHLKTLTVPLLLGIAYAASLGGTGTPIGTPPNLIYMQVTQDQFGLQTTFPQWMSFGVPIVFLFLPIMCFWLTRHVESKPLPALEAPGPWKKAEVRVLVVFALTALAWMTRSAPWGGWQSWLNLPSANDASVAFLAVILLCMIPNSDPKAPGRLLDWPTIKAIPWGVLILFAGGITIARAFMETGLSDALADQLTVVSTLPGWLMILTVCLGVTFLTEVTSNTATTSLLMPILAATAVATDIPPELLMLPAAISASCAFMLPVATAPNAVVYGSGQVTVKDMMREGLALNLIGVVIITLIIWLRF